jgi:small-conductance mechanosensitive channel
MQAQILSFQMGDLLSQHLINWTMQNRNKQVDFTLTIPYEAELKEVSKLIKQTLEKMKRSWPCIRPRL